MMNAEILVPCVLPPTSNPKESEQFRRKDASTCLIASRVRLAAAVVSAVLVAAIALLDSFTGPKIGISAFYLIPICIVTWLVNRPAGLAAALACAAAWLLVELGERPAYTLEWTAFWNALIRLTFFAVVVLLLARIKKMKLELEALIAQRTSRLLDETAERKRVSQEVIDVSNNERRRIAHDLHDGLGQFLTGIAFKAKVLQQTLEGLNHPDAIEAGQIAKLANAANEHAQRLARGLDPIEVEANGLVPALQYLASSMEAQFGVKCSFSSSPEIPPLEKQAALHLFRIAQEAFNNAFKHARAGRIWMDLCLRDSALILRVRNNGQPMQTETLKTGMGLRIMRYRSEAIGGQMEISNSPEGVTITCAVPDIERLYAGNGAP